MEALYPGTPMPQRQQDLIGKVAVITGASRGIGRAIAMNLASRGCSILGTCSSSEHVYLFDSMRHSVLVAYPPSTSGPRPVIVGIAADIFSPNCHQILADALERYFNRRVDVFVNNACDPMPGLLGELTAEEIQRSLLGNIQTPVLIVDEFVKRKMFQPNSRIIYISSIRTRQPWSQQLMYSAGKCAGECLCRTWSQAFGGKEEKVQSISGIDTYKSGLTVYSTLSWQAQRRMRSRLA